MPVFYSPVPPNLRPGPVCVGGSVFNNNRTADSSDFNRDHDDGPINELSSHLPLQMLLYLNAFYFPCWWLSAVCMLQLKYPYLAGHYQALLVAGMVLLTVFEVVRLYLGYAGNLGEKVPELAGFFLLSLLFQLPVLLFFLTDHALLLLPLEAGVHGVLLALLLAQILSGGLALRRMTRQLGLRFHRRQLGEPESLRPSGGPLGGPVYGSPYSRSVLPMPPNNNNNNNNNSNNNSSSNNSTDLR